MSYQIAFKEEMDRLGVVVMGWSFLGDYAQGYIDNSCVHFFFDRMRDETRVNLPTLPLNSTGAAQLKRFQADDSTLIAFVYYDAAKGRFTVIDAQRAQPLDLGGLGIIGSENPRVSVVEHMNIIISKVGLQLGPEIGLPFIQCLAVDRNAPFLIGRTAEELRAWEVCAVIDLIVFDGREPNPFRRIERIALESFLVGPRVDDRVLFIHTTSRPRAGRNEILREECRITFLEYNFKAKHVIRLPDVKMKIEAMVRRAA